MHELEIRHGYNPNNDMLILEVIYGAMGGTTIMLPNASNEAKQFMQWLSLGEKGIYGKHGNKINADLMGTSEHAYLKIAYGGCILHIDTKMDYLKRVSTAIIADIEAVRS